MAGRILNRFAATIAFFGSTAMIAQTPAPAPPNSTIIVRSSLVLVPAMVKTKAGKIVYTLTANDFVVTDDGVEQKVTLDEDTEAEPLALVVVVENGGSGARHLKEYRNLGPTLDAVVGNVPHRVAVVSFDSAPILVQRFTPDVSLAVDAIGALKPGNESAAILDSLGLAADLLRRQPPAYRRAILLISETVDNGSQLKVEQALRAISDTNTTIYCLSFSSTKAGMKHEMSKLSSSEAGPAGGCMSRAPDADPDANGNRIVQAWDCLSLLAPPLRIAKLAEIGARNAMQQNVPKTVASLTGGEYFAFKNAQTLERGLLTVSNDLPNRYVLGFYPQSPSPGLHAIGLHLKDRPNLVVEARSGYWFNENGTAATQR